MGDLIAKVCDVLPPGPTHLVGNTHISPRVPMVTRRSLSLLVVVSALVACGDGAAHHASGADAAETSDSGASDADDGDAAPDAATDAASDAAADSQSDVDAAATDADAGELTLEQACAAQCATLAECAPQPPTPEEIEGCHADCANAVAGRSAECDAAMIPYTACLAAQSCTVLAQGAPDPADHPCHDVYVTFGEACFLAGLPTCVAISPVGGPCQTTNHCEAGAWCEAGVCAAAAGQDEPCTEGTRCTAGLACRLETGVCGPVPGQGEACALAEQGPFLCGEGLGCVTGDAIRETTCEPLPTLGQTCTIDSRCGDGLGCDFAETGSFCVERRGAGGACQTDATCQAGHYCEFSTLECTPFAAAGAPCEDGNECGPGSTCAPVSPSAFACAPSPAVGEPCFLGCAAGAYCGQ